MPENQECCDNNAIVSQKFISFFLHYQNKSFNSNYVKNSSYVPMMIRIIILIIFSIKDLLAVERQLTGTVLDYETKEPLPYANIVVLGTDKGTVSNSEGNFVFDMTGIAETDTIGFSYMGYSAVKMLVSQLQNPVLIYLHPAAIKLNEVNVLSKKLTAEEIIKLTEKNFKDNHTAVSDRQRIFYHRHEKIPFKKENQVIVKKSDFAGIDKKIFDDILKKIPEEFVGYQDAILELYSHSEDCKVVPVKAISLEENAQQALIKEFETKFGSLIEDIEKSNKDPEVYYKFRTGILSQKIEYDTKEGSAWSTYKNDTMNYTVHTELVKSEILFLFNDYAHLDSKNWEFINHTNRYDYVLDDMMVYNDDLVYKISFKAKNSGLFIGTIYVSTSSYAVMELDFAFAPGKRTEKFQLLGIGHSMNFKEGRVIFAKGKAGYYPKYISARQNEAFSVDRNFSIIKKRKRFLIDKELNEIKLDANLSFDTHTFSEILVLEREEIDKMQYEKVQQPRIVKFKKEYTYKADMWGNNTVLAPANELKKYKRK